MAKLILVLFFDAFHGVGDTDISTRFHETSVLPVIRPEPRVSRNLGECIATSLLENELRGFIVGLTDDRVGLAELTYGVSTPQIA